MSREVPALPALRPSFKKNRLLPVANTMRTLHDNRKPHDSVQTGAYYETQVAAPTPSDRCLPPLLPPPLPGDPGRTPSTRGLVPRFHARIVLTGPKPLAARRSPLG